MQEISEVHSLPTTECDSSQCGFITDNDYRALCKVVADMNSDQCGFISDNNMRSMCRALSV